MYSFPGVLNPEGMRAPDECCRHKALDLIGDLALLGRPLVGHVIAERAGHAMHAALVARIMSDPSLYEILTLDQIAARERVPAFLPPSPVLSRVPDSAILNKLNS